MAMKSLNTGRQCIGQQIGSNSEAGTGSTRVIKFHFYFRVFGIDADTTGNLFLICFNLRIKMPELISTQYEVELSNSEKQKYEELKKDLILQLPDGEITAANAASLTGKLSQMANGAVYADDDSVIRIHDRKLDALEDIIESANGQGDSAR